MQQFATCIVLRRKCHLLGHVRFHGHRAHRRRAAPYQSVVSANVRKRFQPSAECVELTRHRRASSSAADQVRRGPNQADLTQ